MRAALLLVWLCGCLPTMEAADTAAVHDDAADGGAGTDSPALPAECDTAMPVTWDGFAWGFMRSQCDACHSASAVDRHGAPAAVAFDSESQAREWAERIRIRTIDQEDMPPAGGVPLYDLALLDVWLLCGG